MQHLCALVCTELQVYIFILENEDYTDGDHFLTLIIDKCGSHNIRLNDIEGKDR